MELKLTTQEILHSKGFRLLKSNTKQKTTECIRCGDVRTYWKYFDLRASTPKCRVCTNIPLKLVKSPKYDLWWDSERKSRVVTLKGYALDFLCERSRDALKVIKDSYLPDHEESFKYIKNTNNKYAVSSNGRVIRFFKRYIKLVGDININDKGTVLVRYTYGLRRRSIRVLAAEYLPFEHKGLIVLERQVGEVFDVYKHLRIENAEDYYKERLVSEGGDSNSLKRIPVALAKDGVIYKFSSMYQAGKFLIEEGYTKNKSIRSVRQRMEGGAKVSGFFIDG